MPFSRDAEPLASAPSQAPILFSAASVAATSSSASSPASVLVPVASPVVDDALAAPAAAPPAAAIAVPAVIDKEVAIAQINAEIKRSQIKSDEVLMLKLAETNPAVFAQLMQQRAGAASA